MQDINRLKLLLAEKYKIGTWLSEEIGLLTLMFGNCWLHLTNKK